MNFIGQKYKINDYLLLNIESIENVDFTKINDPINNINYYRSNKSIDISMYWDSQDTNTIKAINTNLSNSSLNSLAYKCKLYISTKELETRFNYLVIKTLNSNEVLFSELINISNAYQSKIFTHNNELYSGYIEIYLPLKLWDNNNISFASLENVVTSLNFNLSQQYQDLKFETFTNSKILDKSLDFNLEITPNKFLNIQPFVINNTESVEKYLNRIYNSDGFSSVIKISYVIKFITQSGNFDIIRASNEIDNFDSLSLMINTEKLVTSINDLPINITVNMEIEIDNLLLTREKNITLNHKIRTANEVVNNLNINDLVAKEIIEKTEIINQKIIQTPDVNDPQREIVKLNTPIFGQVIKGDFYDFTNETITFNELKNFNLPSDSNVYLNVNNENIIGYNSSNFDIYFNLSEFKNTKFNSNDDFNISLVTNFNGELKSQIILTGKIK